MMKLFRLLTVFLLLSTVAAYAQRTAVNRVAPAAAKPASTPVAVAPVSPTGLTPEELNKPFRGSFFLSPLEIAAIQQALEGRVTKNQTLQSESAPVVPAHRVIRVAGVLYRSAGDWIVWMNDKKVTPDDLLPEIVDISVKPSSKVSLQWYDVGLNQVLSITLRPHQTYDITTGVLLPQ